MSVSFSPAQRSFAGSAGLLNRQQGAEGSSVAVNPLEVTKARQAEAFAAAAAAAQTSSGGQEEAQDAVVKQLSEAKQVGDTLKNSASQSDNNKRADKIAQIEQKIESLKQRLKFATPAQARALIRELKELGKEFKEAAQSLSGGGGVSAAMAGATAISVTAAAGTAGAAGSAATGAQAAGPAATLAVQGTEGAAGAAVSQAQAADAGAAQTQTAQTTQPTQAQPDAGGEGEAAASTSAGSQQGTSEAGDADGTAAAGTAGGDEDEGKALALQTSMREAIAGYTAAKPAAQEKAERKQAADQAAADAAIKAGHHDKLSKLKKEIDVIAKQIEALADKDDPEQRRELEKAKRELAEGQKALDGYALERLRNSEIAGGGDGEADADADAETGAGGIAPGDGAADMAVSGTQVTSRPASPAIVSPGSSIPGGAGMPLMALSVPLTLNLRADVTV